MTPATLLFVRHGESLANLRRTMSHRAADWDLTPAGRYQAERVGEALCDETIAAIWCSPMRRTRQTALPLLRTTGVSLRIHEGLRELNVGSWDGSTDQWDPHHAILDRWAEGDPAPRFPGGEDYAEAAARFGARLLEIAEQSHSMAQGMAVVFGHTGIATAILPQLCSIRGENDGRPRMANGSITRLRLGTEGWECHGWASTHHLTAIAP